MNTVGCLHIGNQSKKPFIAEYNKGRSRTIGRVDLSIVALAKTLQLPILSMEKPSGQHSAKRMRIPELCARENVTRLKFIEFMEFENIVI